MWFRRFLCELGRDAMISDLVVASEFSNEALDWRDRVSTPKERL